MKRISLILIFISLFFILTSCRMGNTYKNKVVFIYSYDNYGNVYIDYSDIFYDIPSDYNITYPNSGYSTTVIKNNQKYQLTYWTIADNTLAGKYTSADFPVKLSSDYCVNYSNQILTQNEYYSSIVFVSHWEKIEE